MYQTIRLSSCVSVQGDLVEALPNGEAIIRDGGQVYRGRPIAPFVAAVAATAELRKAPHRDDR
jgi:hypothetical protein